MGKKTIPILIGAMSMALLGIIFIQYKWIEQSFEEKQKLIDHKVHELVDNVDQHMTDMNALAFVSMAPTLDSTFQERLLNPFDYGKYDTITDGDSMIVSIYQTYEDSFSRREMEMRIISSDQPGFIPGSRQYEEEDSLNIFMENNEFEAMSVELGDISSMLKKVQLEVGGKMGYGRLDSVALSEELISESKALGLPQPTDWGVYDYMDNKYVISPLAEQSWDYDLPLFKEDLIHPNRYSIRLNPGNTNSTIWSQIVFMIILSVVFIALIIFVFVYAIRLVIKHKKISEIKSDFINNMTHEFKTPLASISLAADSIIHPKIMHDPEKVHDYIDIIKTEKNKLNRHIETILEVASLRKDDIEIELSNVELNGSITGAIEKLSLLIEDRNCILDQHLEKEIMVRGNAYHLENVFSNLIENGIKYSGEHPRISITSEKKNDSVIIKVKDEGIGMTKDQMKKAFDNFYRAQKGNIHNTKGFGLGLSFVKFMVHKMNGTIRMESEINKGTTVILEFPLWH